MPPRRLRRRKANSYQLSWDRPQASVFPGIKVDVRGRVFCPRSISCADFDCQGPGGRGFQQAVVPVIVQPDYYRPMKSCGDSALMGDRL